MNKKYYISLLIPRNGDKMVHFIKEEYLIETEIGGYSLDSILNKYINSKSTFIHIGPTFIHIENLINEYKQILRNNKIVSLLNEYEILPRLGDLKSLYLLNRK